MVPRKPRKVEASLAAVHQIDAAGLHEE